MSCLTSSDIVIKMPDEVRNVSMDFTEELSEGVTIDSQSISISPSGITTSSISNVAGVIYFTISGGTSGTNYSVEVTIETSDNQTIIGRGILKVRDR